MDSYSLLPSHNIKLEPACQTDHAHSSAKEMTTEVQIYDMIDSELPVNIKIEQPEVDVKYISRETLTCSQNVPSFPMQEHSQMEMMMYGSVDSKFVTQKHSNVLIDDRHQMFSKMVDIKDCSCDHKMTGHSDTESRMARNSYEASRGHQKCSQISYNGSSIFGVNRELLLTNKNCQFQNTCNVEGKAGDKQNMSGVCGSSVNVDSYLSRHKKKYTEEQLIKCDYSDTSADSLKTHKRTHTGEKLYKCDDCSASFTSASNLKIHKRTHTGERPFKCDDCGASFAHAGNLKNHKRIHTGEKPYKCDDCGASFTDASNVKIHKRTHTKELPYKCDNCSASFTDASSLKKHKRTHTGEKPYKCDDCGASFAQVSHLKTHKRTHTGEKPYKCDDCGASFAQVSHLKTHKRTHTGEKPYRCDDCGASFSVTSNLKKHEKTYRR